MTSIPAPLAPRLFSPAWWKLPKVRARLIGAGVLALAYAVGLGYGSWTRVCAAERCPSISRLLSGPGPQQTSKVFAADGRLITEVGLERRTVIRLADMPPCLRSRSSPSRTSASTRITGSTTCGSSARSTPTCVAQLGAGLLDHHHAARAQRLPRPHLPREKTLIRKLEEAGRAWLEQTYPKDRILELYLNQINLGPAPTAWRRRRSATSASRRATSTWPRPPCSPRSPRRRAPTIRAATPRAPSGAATW